jgi:hypothetical protein
MTDAQFRLHNTQVVVLKRILDYLVSVNEGNKEPVAELKAGLDERLEAVKVEHNATATRKILLRD